MILVPGHVFVRVFCILTLYTLGKHYTINHYGVFCFLEETIYWGSDHLCLMLYFIYKGKRSHMIFFPKSSVKIG